MKLFFLGAVGTKLIYYILKETYVQKILVYTKNEQIQNKLKYNILQHILELIQVRRICYLIIKTMFLEISFWLWYEDIIFTLPKIIFIVRKCGNGRKIRWC